MKYFKIAITIIVFGVVAFLIWKWIDPTNDTDRLLTKPNNPKVAEELIRKDIDSIERVPDNVFCDKLYHSIVQKIISYQSQNAFGEKAEVNDRCADRLQNDLYTTYVAKFLSQANYTFTHADWEKKDRDVIKKEANKLLKSQYLDPNAGAADKLQKAKKEIEKYDEIIQFVESCKNCPFPDFNINTQFNQSEKIQKSRNYPFDGTHVNNCTQLQNELKKCPQYLFNRHKEYLATKLKKLYDEKEEYKKFAEQPIYHTSMYSELNKQIDHLRYNHDYGVERDVLYAVTNTMKYDLESVKHKKANQYFINLKSNNY